MTDETNTRHPSADTGDGWRRLGFYHEPDRAANVWKFFGSTRGLGELARALRDCADSGPSHNDGIRLGPYEDLAVNRWERKGIDYQGIYGPPEALRELADVLDRHLAEARPGDSFTVGEAYASDVEYRLLFEIKRPDFDPTSLMPATVTDGGTVLDDTGDHLRVSESVPCMYHDPNALITETHGLVRLEGDQIVFEFETRDAVFGAFRSGAQEVRLPLESVSWIRFKRGVFGAKLSVQARDMISMADLPTAKPGLVILKFKRVNRDFAEMLAEQLDDALAE